MRYLRITLRPGSRGTRSVKWLLVAASLALLTLLPGSATVLHAQSTPSITVELSPAHSVPRNTEIIATITLSDLDPASYPSLVVRVEVTPVDDAPDICRGTDTGKDLAVPVDSTSEVLTASVFSPCSPYEYGIYALHVSASLPNDQHALASVSTHFSFSRYLTPEYPIQPPPEPGTRAWLDPDPRTIDFRVHGAWRRLAVRADVELYTGDHLNLYLNAGRDATFVSMPALHSAPTVSPEEACQDERKFESWRRAIHQWVWLVACTPGEAVMTVRHETQAVAPLFTYEFQVPSGNEQQEPSDLQQTVSTGGGGGGPSGPSPSTADFEWTVKHDIDALNAANGNPSGIWSDGATLWVAENPDGPGDAVFAYDLADGERQEEREFVLDELNRAPRGLWSDGSTIWVSDSGRNRLFAHDLATGERLPDHDLASLSDRNANARGIWSDSETMWVLDGSGAVFAYDLANGELTAEYDLHPSNANPHGIWSDGATIWVSDHGAKRLFAYHIEDGVLGRQSDEEFDDLSAASNNSPRGIWSDGALMYVADASDGKVYTYNFPDALDTRLASLTLAGLDIGEFASIRTAYRAVVPADLTETTVSATSLQRETSIVPAPADAGGDDSDGHQVSLGPTVGEITVTVTSPDGSRVRTYRVGLNYPLETIALAAGWTLFQWPGRDGIPVADAIRGDNDSSGISDKVLAIYQWEEATGSWLAFIPGHEEVPGLNTLTTFASGQTYWIATTEATTWTVPRD